MIGLFVTITIEIALIFIGAIFLIVSNIIQTNENKKRQNCTIMTSGVITGIKVKRLGSSSDHSRLYSYFPVYEYDTGKGRVQTTSNIGVSKNKLKVGQRICIYYSPHDKNDNYVPELSADTTCKVFKYVGALLLITAIIVFIFSALIQIALFY